MAKDRISKRLADTVSFMRSSFGRSTAGTFSGPPDSTFELFGLDPKKPRDHQILLSLLDFIIFSKGKAGAPKKTTEWGRSPRELRADIATVNHGLTKKKSVRETCRILIEDKDKRFDERYAYIKPEALRHMVRKIK